MFEKNPGDQVWSRLVNTLGSVLTPRSLLPAPSFAMHFRRVYLESFGYTLPDEIVTTAELERRLAPLYERLRLPEGRLELMTGIRERRFFPAGTRPSSISIESARRGIEASGNDRRDLRAPGPGSGLRAF